jgi:molybdopterin-guanine dinucleotide biosynthesis protein A
MASDFSTLLLAGGRSTRMGEDKALMLWSNQPLWLSQFHKLEQLSPARLLISCREEQGLQNVVLPGAEWLFDPPGQDCGPLGPILHALTLVRMPLLVLAVDMPNMEVGFLEQILSQCSMNKGLFFKGNEGVEPLAGIYTPDLASLLQAAFDAGRYSLQRVVTQAEELGLVDFQGVSEEDAKFFFNTNTAQQWQQACQ